MIIILLISSCSLFFYLIMHAIFIREPGAYGLFFDNHFVYFFMNIFGIVAFYGVYPILFLLFIIFLRMARLFPRKAKGKLLAAAFLQLSALGINILFSLIRTIRYGLASVIPMSYDSYQRISSANIILGFFIDYLTITIAMLLLSITLVEQKTNAGYTGNALIAPLVVLPLTGIWLILVMIHYIIYEIVATGILAIIISAIASLTSVVMIAMYAEILVKMQEINSQQIITAKEKIA